MSVPSRRAVLGVGLAGGAAAVLAACESGGKDPAPAADSPSSSRDSAALADFDPQDWDSVRAQINLDPELAQFAAFVLSPHTKVLDAAIAGYRDQLSTDTEHALLAGYDLENAVRSAASEYAGGDPVQYAITDSTTMGIATMYGGLTLAPGDEVLTTTHDFYSTEESLRLLAQRSGATISQVTLYDNPAEASVDEMVGRLAAGITSRTKVVALTWVHSSTGVRIPVQEIAGCARRAREGPAQPVRHLRRRRARVQRGRRRPARPRLRLPGHRHPQVAVRAARHRDPLGPRLGTAHRADPVVLRRPGRLDPDDRRRLPGLRAGAHDRRRASVVRDNWG